MPKWILNILCTFTAPQIMRGLEQRYIANVRKAGKTLDLTTAEARRKAAHWPRRGSSRKARIVSNKHDVLQLIGQCDL